MSSSFRFGSFSLPMLINISLQVYAHVITSFIHCKTWLKHNVELNKCDSQLHTPITNNFLGLFPPKCDGYMYHLLCKIYSENQQRLTILLTNKELFSKIFKYTCTHMDTWFDNPYIYNVYRKWLMWVLFFDLTKWKK